MRKSIKDSFVAEDIKQVKLQYGENPLENKDYDKIISNKHFERLYGLSDKNKVALAVLVRAEWEAITARWDLMLFTP